MAKSRYVYDYYNVTIPGDIFSCETREEWLQESAEIAIAQAREDATLYCIPCEWSAHLVDGDEGNFEVTFRVRRKRHRARRMAAFDKTLPG